jgi:methionyl-tRNA synthetase
VPETVKKKSAVVTSALPYANGEIHLGHIASTYLPADIFTRFSKLSGQQTYHICATDDFGTPILVKAEKEKKSPEEYVSIWNKRDYDDFNSVGILFDFFYKTSSKENIEFVQYVFNRLYENGHIYDQNVIQFYCTYDDKFLPDRYVVGKCPYCGAENQYSDVCEKCGRVPEQILEPKCAICGRPPIKKESKHYFFRLSSFGPQLKEWLLANEHLQVDVKNYVINWISEGLQDWDITRNLTWGIPIPLPDAKGKVFYGWFDNHLCYISSLVKFINSNNNENVDGKTFWNESDIYHFIGKDIVYHHYLFLPAIRMGINEEYKLPDYLPTRGHLMLQNQKISKSRNWYIGLREFTSAFNPDYLRFYIASVVTYSQDDLNFDWDTFYDKINNELIANVGNFINRSLSFTQKGFNGKLPSPLTNVQNTVEAKEFAAVVDETEKLMSANEIDKALKRILKYSTYMNHYFQANAPWANRESSATTLYVSVNAVRSLSILLEPFIPFSAEKIWIQLKLDGSVHRQSWKSAKDISAIKPGHILGKVEPLFRKVESKEIEQWKNKLGKANNNND